MGPSEEWGLTGHRQRCMFWGNGNVPHLITMEVT